MLVVWQPNGEYAVEPLSMWRESKFYPCCTEPWPEIFAAVKLKRHPEFYVKNLIIPTAVVTWVLLERLRILKSSVRLRSAAEPNWVERWISTIFDPLKSTASPIYDYTVVCRFLATLQFYIPTHDAAVDRMGLPAALLLTLIAITFLVSEDSPRSSEPTDLSKFNFGNLVWLTSSMLETR